MQPEIKQKREEEERDKTLTTNLFLPVYKQYLLIIVWILCKITLCVKDCMKVRGGHFNLLGKKSRLKDSVL